MRRQLAAWITLSDEHWSTLSGLFRPALHDAGEQLVLPGEPMQKLFFVVEGLLRFYYIDADGREWNKSFVPEGRFAGALSSYVLGLPAPFAIQAMEPSTLMVAAWADMQSLYERDPVFERLGRRFAEWLAVKKELRERSFLEMGAAARYEAFLREEPELARRVPNYHIASYLGVTEVTLSRIRARANAKN